MKFKNSVKKVVSLCLATALAVGMCANVGIAAAKHTDTQREGNQNYYSNQGSLTDNAFVQLPMGAVKAKQWLEQQMLLQKNGLLGNIQDNYPAYTEDSAWRGGDGDSWEKGPYYFRGLTSVAYVLDDPELKDMAMEWINFCIDEQRDNGFFGPLKDGDGSSDNWDWWPRMVAIQTIRDYYEATELAGDPDERVMPFFEKYFRYQAERMKTKPLSDYWAEARGGDNIEVVLWYYNRVYDPTHPEASDWLIDLCNLIDESTFDWSTIFNETTVREHVVNTTQALKTPAVLYQITGDEYDKNAIREGIFNMSIDHGRVDNLANSDESPRENYPYRGAELCSIAESILSESIAMRVLGEGWIGDDLEKIAYNSLPSGYSADFTGHNYYQAQNQAMLTHGFHDFSNDYGDACCFGAPSGYECCFPNGHMAWAKFVQNMWMATADDGLAIVSYGPNRVTAQVADGKTAIFDQVTDYPFRDTIALNYQGETAEFPLMLRIPEWCANPTVKVNGQEVAVDHVENGYFTLDRTFSKGDQVQLVLPMELEAKTWFNGSVSIERGPLFFSVKVEEDWRETEDRDITGWKPEVVEPFTFKEVYPASRWNYGLVLDLEHLEDSIQVELSDSIAVQPFHLNTAPITLKVTGQVIPEWQLMGNVVPEPPYSPIAPNEALQETIELVPYGCTKIHISQIPVVGQAKDTCMWDAADATLKEMDGKQVLEFDNVMVPNAEDYTLKVLYSGAGQVPMNLNSKYQTTLDLEQGGVYQLDHLKTLNRDGFKFDYGQYNNIRFEVVDGVTIQGIEIVPVGTFEGPEVVSTSATATSVTLQTNIARADGFYSVSYGTEPGVYTMKSDGFCVEDAVLTGLQPDTTYYFQVSMLHNGATVTSQEVAVTTQAAEAGQTIPEVNGAFYDDFSNPDNSSAAWTVLGDQVVTYEDGKMKVGASGNVKAVRGDESWTDYVVEGTFNASTVGDWNNCGVMFRVTDATGNAADDYQGYYVGVGKSGSTPAIVVGYANGGWNSLDAIPIDFQVDTDYTLKVVVYGGSFAVYLNGEYQKTYAASLFSQGQVGVRSWMYPFTCDDFSVRKLTEEDIAIFDDVAVQPQKLEVSEVTYSGFEAAQIKFKKFPDADTYKIQYGTESGDYTHEYVNLKANSYEKTIQFDKTGVSGLENDKTYYIRLVALNGNTVVACSDEVTVVPGFVSNVDAYRVQLEEQLSSAVQVEEPSHKLTDAIAYANQVLDMAQPNMMDYNLAKACLQVGMNYVEQVDPTPEPTPTVQPTAEPTVEPTAQPTSQPSAQPTVQPTDKPDVPQTGDSSNLTIWFVVMLGGVAASVGLMLFDKRRHHAN